MDKKDKQLLEILAQNCRVTNTVMGQALQLSKDAVAYRIKNLEKEGLLKQYLLFIDARKLGFTRYHILIHFDVTIDKQKMYKNLSQNKYVMWINSFIGRFDVQIIVDAVDGFHLNKIRENLFGICEYRVKDYMILTQLYDLEFTQLNPVLDQGTKFTKKLDHSFSSILTTRKFPVAPLFDRYSPAEIEIEILKI